MKTNEHNKPGTSSRLWSIAGAVMQVTLICAFWPLGGRAQSAEAAMKQLRDMDYHVTRANDFTTAFLLAAGKADTNAIELLLAAGLNVDDALLTACNFGELEAARLLINKGANVNAVDSIEGKTMLMYAATRANRLELVKLLVSNLADVNVKDKEGNTVLDYARRDRYTNIVEFLNTRTAGFAEIEGAFGLKLGDTFDVTKGKPTPSGEYEFAAENPVPEFTKYLVSITARLTEYFPSRQLGLHSARLASTGPASSAPHWLRNMAASPTMPTSTPGRPTIAPFVFGNGAGTPS
jgi:hypothetical protein